MGQLVSFVMQAVMAMRCGSWKLAMDLETGHKRLMVNSEWLGKRREVKDE